MQEGVGANMNFVADRFPNLELHSNIDEDDDLASSPSPAEVVATESAELLTQQERLSVRDLASKFEQGLAAAHGAAAKITDETKFRDALLLDRQALLKKLGGLLATLAGRVAGRNKDDMEEALTLVEALTVQLAHRERELAQEKSDARKLASLFKQASDDARKMVEEARAVANAEIEIARAAARRIEAAFQDESKKWSASEKKVPQGPNMHLNHLMLGELYEWTSSYQIKEFRHYVPLAQSTVHLGLDLLWRL